MPSVEFCNFCCMARGPGLSAGGLAQTLICGPAVKHVHVSHIRCVVCPTGLMLFVEVYPASHKCHMIHDAGFAMEHEFPSSRAVRIRVRQACDISALQKAWATRQQPPSWKAHKT